ncbi:MAG: electron transfer flavoprotein beta subunit [Oceanospirillaceae bacterium]|jgi:electron transfer flavoprotein beta subunit
MKILVAIKRVVDANVKVRIKADQSDVELTNIKMAINPFDEIAVEEAVRLKESGIASHVLVVSVGSNACQEQLRTALALGADSALQVEAPDNLEPLAIAKLLAQVVIQEQPKLVILGKQSIDADNNQTGQMLAALTNMAQGTFASKLEIAGDSIKVTREIDGGLQQLELALPAIITADLRLNEPRYASLPNIMKAKRKPLTTVSYESLGVDIATGLTTLQVFAPPERAAGIKVASVSELVEKLQHEAGVI